MAVAAIGISGLGLVGFLGLSFLKDYIAKRQGLNIIHDEGERAVNLEHTTPDIVELVYQGFRSTQLMLAQHCLCPWPGWSSRKNMDIQFAIQQNKLGKRYLTVRSSRELRY